MEIYNNQAINATLLSHSCSYKRREPNRAPGAIGQWPSEFYMQKPCKNLGNGRVRLTYYNPDAETVSVVGGGGAFEGEYPMTRDEQGYWTVEVTVTPGIHTHRYRVNGAMVLSNTMPLVFAAGEPTNAFECVDEDCGFYLMQKVPHGDLRMEYYRSSYTGRWKACWVYTPAGYDANPDKEYPVLYLQHGMGENETGWIDMGKINLIMDNMIAAGECEEMLVVLNCGFAFRPEDSFTMTGHFESELVGDCMPFIEGKYRIRKDRLSRAMAGLSMGSAQAQTIVYHHPDLFAYLGVIIGGFAKVWLGEDMKYVEDPEFLKKNLKVLFATNGDHEPNCEENRQFVENLRSKGVDNAIYRSYPGYHSLTVCRHSIHDFLPMLFK